MRATRHSTHMICSNSYLNVNSFVVVVQDVKSSPLVRWPKNHQTLTQDEYGARVATARTKSSPWNCFPVSLRSLQFPCALPSDYSLGLPCEISATNVPNYRCLFCLVAEQVTFIAQKPTSVEDIHILSAAMLSNTVKETLCITQNLIWCFFDRAS